MPKTTTVGGGRGNAEYRARKANQRLSSVWSRKERARQPRNHTGLRGVMLKGERLGGKM